MSSNVSIFLKSSLIGVLSRRDKLKMRSTSEVLLLSLKSCSIIATRQYVVIAIIEHDLKINRPVIEVMRILGNSFLVKDSIQELMTSIEKNQELKERDQLELDLNFE